MSRVLYNANNQIIKKYNPLLHRGVDIVKYENKTADIIAHSDGIVVEVEKECSSELSSLGNYVKIMHNNGFYTLYSHLNNVLVDLNDQVFRGDILGTMGSTGNAKGTHLHFEVRNANDKKINPTKYLEEDLPNNHENIKVIYQIYDFKLKKWLPNVKSENNYAGFIGHPIGAIYMHLSEGDIKYRVHILNKGWLPIVTNRDDYSGKITEKIDGIQVTSDEVKLIYRVHLLDTGWSSWVYKWDHTSDGYAGIFGQEIDAVQIKIVED